MHEGGVNLTKTKPTELNKT